MPYESGYGEGSGWGDGRGSGWGDGSGYGWGDGEGSGYGRGSGRGCGDGDGRGCGNGLIEERKKIELNILENIPSEELLLYMHCWEFEETKIKYAEKLKTGN
jgi:hypothetical protein